MSKIRLSYSAVDKYKTCPALWKYHYLDKIRPSKVGSALAFGSAIDEALNRMLLEKKPKLTPEESASMELSPETVFFNEFQKVKYNKKTIELIDPDLVEYFKSDVDLSVLSEVDESEIKDFDTEVEDYKEFIEECFAILKRKEELSFEDKRLYNFIAHRCLYRKGLLLIEAYRQEILPEIHTVFNIQRRVNLKDEDGNSIIGFIDAVVSFNDAPKEKVVLDNKTSSTPYKDDSVSISPQLATYAESEGTSKGAYAVVEKKIRKREPRTRTSLIIDEIPEETLESTFEAYDNALSGIKAENFDKNYKSGCFSFGRPCPYFRYCKSDGKIKDGLDFLKETK